MPSVVTETPSRYGLVKDDLRQAALALQLGQGIADRFSTIEVTKFIQGGEDWADSRVAEFYGVPLKSTRAPGQTEAVFAALTLPDKRNFPHDFIKAVIYYATGLLLHSEYFENAPNTSEAGTWALQQADTYLAQFKERRTNWVGAGRQRHPNPFMPPNIAPRTTNPDQRSGGIG